MKKTRKIQDFSAFGEDATEKAYGSAAFAHKKTGTRAKPSDSRFFA
jgi:hypothetical protein